MIKAKRGTGISDSVNSELYTKICSFLPVNFYFSKNYGGRKESFKGPVGHFSWISKSPLRGNISLWECRTKGLGISLSCFLITGDPFSHTGKSRLYPSVQWIWVMLCPLVSHIAGNTCRLKPYPCLLALAGRCELSQAGSSSSSSSLSSAWFFKLLQNIFHYILFNV